MTTFEAEPRYVGFWVRVIALLLDSLILSAVAIAIIVLFFQLDLGLGEGLTFEKQFEAAYVGSLVAFQLIPWGLLAVFWVLFASSPVKLLLGVRILDADTLEHPSVSQILLRLVGYFISSVCLGIGFFWVAFDGRKQGWHDKLARTVVVYRRTLADTAG